MKAGAPETFGPYLVYDEIDKGGMASVHLAERRLKDGSTQKVALKRMLPRAAARRELVQAFRHEARLMRYLKHPNIAETYDFGNVREVYFIAMEYVAGPTLKQLVAHCGMTVGTVPHEITLNIASQVCAALDFAHNQTDEQGKPLGIIHRDVSPSNIILSDSGLVKLIDFGLAKAKTSNAATGEGMIKGKFNYVAPEYLGGKLDARADIWAVGVVMYELLTSRRLFDGPDDFETMTRVRKLPIPRPSLANPHVTPELDEVVMTALERNPGRRWQTAAMMRDAVDGVISHAGNLVDNAHVADWVKWVFTQTPGTEASGVSKLKRITQPATSIPERAAPAAPAAPVHRGVWIVLAFIVTLAVTLAILR